MKVTINGEMKELPSPVTLEQLLERFDMPTKLVAVELNKTVVRRHEWPTTPINEKDRIEIVHFVGGG